MPIRLVAVDLDGTLLNSRSEISGANREALEMAVSRGVELAIVTGRRFHSARPLVSVLKFPLTLISSNGARIGDLGGGACHRNFLPAAIAREVLRAAPDFRHYTVVMYDVAGCGQVIMQHGASLAGPLGWYRKNSPAALLEVPDLEAFIASGVDSGATPCSRDLIQVMFGGPPDEIAPIEPLLASSAIATKVQLTWTKYPVRGTVLLDVMNRHCTKGAALRLWAARRGIEPSEVMALGDNHNDHEMLAFAGRPVVMANAEPGICRPGWTTTLSNDEDGVAAAVWRYVLES
jgi:hypothetical protein